MHYTGELKSQAAKILGSVDFLGNPLGLFNDVAEGVSGLLKDGNVGGLVKNLAHGMSNSAAKVGVWVGVFYAVSIVFLVVTKVVILYSIAMSCFGSLKVILPNYNVLCNTNVSFFL